MNIFRFILSESYRLAYSKKFSHSLALEQEKEEAIYSELKDSSEE